MPLSKIFGNFVRNSVATAAHETCGGFQQALEEDYVERLYQVSWNPKVKLRRLELPQQPVCKKETLVEEQPSLKQDSKSSMKQGECERAHIKEEPEELPTSEFRLTVVHSGPPDSCFKQESHKNEDQSVDCHLAEDNGPVIVSVVSLANSDVSQSHIVKQESSSSRCLERRRYEGQSNIAGNTTSSTSSCAKCGRDFEGESSLLTHLLKHIPKRRVFCKTCGLKCPSHDSLLNHIRTHTVERPHLCHICGETFLIRSALILHLRNHTQNREFCENGSVIDKPKSQGLPWRLRNGRDISETPTEDAAVQAVAPLTQSNKSSQGQPSDLGSDCDPASERDAGCDEAPITTKQTHSAISDETVGEVNVEETQQDVSLMDVDTNMDPSSRSKDQATSSELPSSSNIKPGQNVCFICRIPQYKIARHFKIHRKENSEIEKALSLPARSTQRRTMLDNLRNKGNFLYNQQVISEGSGTLKVKRRTKNASTYDYCIHCKGMYSRRELWRHVRSCKMKPESEGAKGERKVLGVASAIKLTSDHAVYQGLLRMLSQMHDDNVASIVRNDFYLVRYAESLYRKHGHDPTKHVYIRQKIRQVGKFLLAFRKTSNLLNFEDAVKPENFLKVTEAVKNVAGYNRETNGYKVPSLAIKIGTSLLKINDIIHGHAIMTDNEPLAKLSEAFRKLHRKKWSEYVSRFALKTISGSKSNKPTKRPLTEDVAKLNEHLDKTAEAAAKELGAVATAHSYRRIAEAALTKMVLFNRRPVGEVSRMKLKDFVERGSAQSGHAVGLPEHEQKLCGYFQRAELRGKRGRKVAALMTPDMTSAVSLMVRRREECGVPKENRYLFAAPYCLSHYRGDECLKRFAEECGAQTPDYSRSTQLRKDVATTSRILHLKTSKHPSVHRQFYRRSEPTVQWARISRLLLVLEKGKLHELRGENLDSIGSDNENEDKDQGESDSSEDEQSINGSAEEAATCSEDEDEGPNTSREVADVSVKSTVEKKIDRMESVQSKKSIKRRRDGAPNRRPWTTKEVNAVMRHFSDHIKKRKLASKRECEICRTSESALKERTTQNIRDFVRNKGRSRKR